MGRPEARGAASAGIGYVRVSTAAQVADGDGLGVQRDKIAAWCSFQSVVLEETFEDAGISGATTDNRPGLKAALRRALERGENATLIVYKLDRLGRDALDVQEALAVLLEAGVRVVSISDGVDSASGMGAALLKLLTSILATFAELEKETIRARLLDGRRRADAGDRTYASEPRYGRRRRGDSRELELDESEARAIALISSMHGEGKSVRAICAALAEAGLKPRRGKAWSTAVVHRIATGRRAPKKSSRTTRISRARAELLKEGKS